MLQQTEDMQQSRQIMGKAFELLWGWGERGVTLLKWLVIAAFWFYVLGALFGIFCAGCCDTMINIPRPTRH